MSKYWAAMTDKFMSGWGKAEGLINKLVIECDNYEEALVVADNGRNRSEMKYINICMNKPSYNANRYLTNYHGKEDYHNWFKAGYFKK